MDLFSKIAHRYDNIIPSFDIDSIIDYLPLTKEDLLVDLGGGTGRVATKLLEHVNECIIFDRSNEMLQQVRNKTKGLYLVQGAAENQPFRKNSITSFFVNDVFHHLKKQEQTLENIKEILTDGGNLIVRDYDRKYFWNIFLLIFEKLLLFGSRFLTPYELETMCNELDFFVNWRRITKGTYLLIARK